MKKILFLLSAVTLAGGGAMAAPERGQWSVRVLGGGDLPAGGRLHAGTQAPIANLGVLDPALEGLAGTLDIMPRGNQRFYTGGLSGSFELGYAIRDGGEIFAGFRYQGNKPGEAVVGTAIVPAAGVELPVFGRFDRLRAYTGEVGYRHYFMRESVIRPYVAGRAGVTFTDSIDATFTVPGTAIVLPDTPFYRNSVSATLGGDIGAAIALTKGLDLNLETGVRWTSGLRTDDAALPSLGLQDVNQAGARVDVPIRAGFTVRF
ncbi:MAG: hypothetical protein SNJ63_07475 [Sphingomonadaceae bacterium]